MKESKWLTRVRLLMASKKRIILRDMEYSGTQRDAAQILRNAGYTVECNPSGSMFVSK